VLIVPFADATGKKVGAGAHAVRASGGRARHLKRRTLL
jgi:hypothetical protein